MYKHAFKNVWIVLNPHPGHINVMDVMLFISRQKPRQEHGTSGTRQMVRVFPIISVKTVKEKYLWRYSSFSEKFPVEKSVPFDFSPEQPVSQSKWKTPIDSFTSHLCEQACKTDPCPSPARSWHKRYQISGSFVARKKFRCCEKMSKFPLGQLQFYIFFGNSVWV